MTTSPAQPQLPAVQQPERWHLALAIGAQRIDGILYAPSQRGSLRVVALPLEGSLPTLAAVESAVYDHPELLDDYGSVSIVARAPHFVLLPSEVGADEALAKRAYAATFPDDDLDVTLCHLERCGATVAYGLERGLAQFVQRTFSTPPVVHHLHPLCEHFAALNAGASIARMLVNLRKGAMDVVVFDSGRLALANSLTVRGSADAAYLLLHTWRSLGLDALADELQLAGDKTLRDPLTAEMRKYINYVMPAILPAASLAHGAEATQAPLDLILLASCE